MTLADIPSLMALATAEILRLQNENDRMRILTRSALAELNDALACANVKHPKLDAAADYLRLALDPHSSAINKTP